MRFFLSQPHVTFFHKTILSFLVIGASAGFFCTQAQAAGQIDFIGMATEASVPTPPASPIVGNITFAGTVTLDSNTVNTATTVTGWAGPGPTPSPGSLPNVQSRDGSFAATVNVGDLTTFSAPWTFNTNTTITNFWSVDNFTFDLTASNIVFQNSGFLVVQGTGVVKSPGFLDTAGTWNFTTQDSSASGEFSFSGSTAAVPEGSTVSLLMIGMLGLVAIQGWRRTGILRRAER
jgi:hypothetical protein